MGGNWKSKIIIFCDDYDPSANRYQFLNRSAKAVSEHWYKLRREQGKTPESDPAADRVVSSYLPPSTLRLT